MLLKEAVYMYIDRVSVGTGHVDLCESMPWRFLECCTVDGVHRFRRRLQSMIAPPV